MEYLVGKGGAVKLMAEQEGGRGYPASNQDLHISRGLVKVMYELQPIVLRQFY